MKKYTSPEMTIVKIQAEDVILTSGEITTAEMPNTTFNGAEQLDTQNFSIFD